jgi:hypothetical protein
MKKRYLGWIGAALLTSPVGANAVTISLGIDSTDFGSPDSVGISFLSTMPTISGLAAYSFSGSFTLTDASGDGVSISNFSGVLPEYWRIGVGDPFSLLDDIGGTSSLVGNGTYQFTSSGTFDCSSLTLGCTNLYLALAFLGSGGGDRVTGMGLLTLEPSAVAEPGTLALLAIGMAGIGLSRRLPSAQAHGLMVSFIRRVTKVRGASA